MSATFLRRLMLGLVVLCLFSCSKQVEFEVTDLVIREAPPGAETGVAYLAIRNNSDKSLVLNYVHTPRTSMVEVHRHLYENGLMKMREVRHLTVDPQSTVEFTPGGYHLMLFGADSRFEAGQEVPITFEFENKPPLTMSAQVRRL